MKSLDPPPLRFGGGAALNHLRFEMHIARRAHREPICLVHAGLTAVGERQHPLPIGADVNDAEIQPFESLEVRPPSSAWAGPR